MVIEKFTWEQPQPRIVQYRKQRFALRLETIFWDRLFQLAAKRNIRIGQLVAELADSCDGPNLSSYVRGFCMLETEREATRYRLNAGTFNLLDIMRGCPAPALLLNQQRIILDTNQALLDWIGQFSPGKTMPLLRQKKFDDVFQPRGMRTLDETLMLMRTGQLKRTQVQIAYVPENQSPRIVMATLTGLPVGNVFYVLVWLGISNTYHIIGR